MVYAFGPFSFDTREARLLRDGTEVSLTPKAADLLRALLERHGQLVTKPELFERVWAGTFVTDSTLTFHVHLVRKALGVPAGANEDAYVEVVRGRGYRFIAPVTEHEHATVVPAKPAAAVESAGSGPRVRTPWRVSSALALVLIIGSVIGTTVIGGHLVLEEALTPAIPRVVNVRQLTHVGGAGVGDGLLFSDGLRVYFNVTDRHGVFRFVSVGTQGGVAEPVWPGSEFAAADISAPRSEVLARRSACRDEKGCELWAVPLAGGSPRHVGGVLAITARWSADGQRIVYAYDHDLRIANADGSGVRTVIAAPGVPGDLSWSPDGTLLRYTLPGYLDGLATSSLWEVRADGTDAHALLPGWNTPPGELGGNWTPDGRFFAFSSFRDGRTDLWLLPERHRLLTGRTPQPIRLAAGPIGLNKPQPTPDGKQLLALGQDRRGELLRYDRALGTFVPFWDGVSALQVGYSRDGRWASFITYPEQTLWRARPDGQNATQLTFAPMAVDGHAWSPDGQWIAIHARKPGTPWQIYLLPSAGGSPRRLTTRSVEEGMPSWSADGTRIAFGDVPPFFEHPFGNEVIHIYDVIRHQLDVLPGSQGLWTSRWSPDGRFIAALTIRGLRLKLFDVNRGTWQSTDATRVNDPSWSRDSTSLFFDTDIGDGRERELATLRVRDGRVERLTGLSHYGMLAWAGLAPDDSPLMLRNLGSLEVYVVDLKTP